MDPDIPYTDAIDITNDAEFIHEMNIDVMDLLEHSRKGREANLAAAELLRRSQRGRESIVAAEEEFLLEDGFRGGLKRRDTMQLIERCRQDRKNKIAVEEQLAQSCRERELDAARADWVVRVIDQDLHTREMLQEKQFVENVNLHRVLTDRFSDRDRFQRSQITDDPSYWTKYLNETSDVAFAQEQSTLIPRQQRPLSMAK